MASGAFPDRFLPPDPRVEEPYRHTPRVALRVAILALLTLGLFAILFLRLWALQVLSGHRYLSDALNNQVRSVPIEAPRGSIVDRNGRLLVTNVPGTQVLLWPSDLRKRTGRDTELRRLSKVLGVPMKTIVAKIKARAGDSLTPITLQVAVHKDQVAYLLEHKDEFPGIEISQTYLRRYRAEALAAHVFGYTREISAAQLKDGRKCYVRTRSGGGARKYQAADVIGQSGIEAAYDCELRGLPGKTVRTVDSLGRPTGAPRDEIQPVSGNTIRLTLDISLQRAAERALRYGIGLARADGHWAANGGAVVAMDPRDGSILALASNPTYKPGVWVGRLDPKRVKVLLDPKAAKAANYPGLDRAIDGTYPAGSTFKPVTALAALGQHLVSPYESLPCTGEYVVRGQTGAGQTFKNWDPSVNENMTMPTAIAASCDTYFYRVGYMFYGLPGNLGHPLQDWASRFGIGARTGIDIGPESGGLLPTPEWLQQTFTKKSDPCCWQIDSLWKPGDSIQLAIGQKDLLVTPLQMTRFYAMIANGGKLVTPHLLGDVEAPGGNPRAPKVLPGGTRPWALQKTGVDPAALAVVRDGLYGATHGTNGTATSVFGSYPVAIAGKTGTAEKVVTLPGFKGLMDQSWWCGYAPADSPTITVCALIENGGHGGTAAAPAALKVFEEFFHLPGVYVPPANSD